MKLVDADYALEHLPNDLPYKASVKRVLTQLPEATIFDGVSFVEFRNDAGGAEDKIGFIVAICGLSEIDFCNLEQSVCAVTETMTTYDSIEEKVREILNDMGVRYKIIYPDKFITI